MTRIGPGLPAPQRYGEYPRTKERPRSVTIFGAAGHIGRPLAEHLRFAAPDVALRLITTSSDRAVGLSVAFPESEVVIADLMDAATLSVAVEGSQGVFVVTPSPFDESVAMANLIAALRADGSLTHLVRVVGYEPESRPERVPQSLREYQGTAQQHYVAKRLLDESGLPVTYLNIGATYLDNLLPLARTVKSDRVIVLPQRIIPFIDPRDVGEIAANLLTSTDARHLDQFYTVNNGNDLLTTEELAEIFSDVLKTKITAYTRPEAFVELNRDQLARRRGRPDAAERVLEFIAYEQGNGAFLSLNDFARRMLGREPTTVRGWVMEHRHHFLPHG
ncbi:NmrA family NAD(P)-binding protein [Microbacterium sp. CPCC 204701]|uniref:NmrA family NAD(P)-binding protein n=1 Tax=Microbacterium sp. CPCC 204701 TaxID=2493084 RepID=UPI0013E3030A|nr:NmrA family NAD(P)-binding protein [Microbacterium sp. CPCC 204701]